MALEQKSRGGRKKKSRTLPRGLRTEIPYHATWPSHGLEKKSCYYHGANKNWNSVLPREFRTATRSKNWNPHLSQVPQNWNTVYCHGGTYKMWKSVLPQSLRIKSLYCTSTRPKNWNPVLRVLPRGLETGSRLAAILARPPFHFRTFFLSSFQRIFNLTLAGEIQGNC